MAALLVPSAALSVEADAKKIRFVNATQTESLAREATPEEQTALEKCFEEECPPGDERPLGDGGEIDQ